MDYTSYDSFAYVYDELMDNVPYDEWCERLDKLIEKYGISSKKLHRRNDYLNTYAEGDFCVEADSYAEIDSCADADACSEKSSNEEILRSEKNLVLDLGCGTGTLTELMYEKGYDMIGVDLSNQMLGIAQNKRYENNYDILYINQDMRELDLYSTVGTVFSVCDSINYLLTDEDVLKTFSLVNKFLFPKGLFIFDFNTVYKYMEVIGDTVIAENRDDCSFIWENFYNEDDGINEYDLTIFIKDAEEEIYYKNCETHFQRGYSMEEMLTFLNKTNFEILTVIDSDNEEAVSETTERILVVARKI